MSLNPVNAGSNVRLQKEVEGPDLVQRSTTTQSLNVGPELSPTAHVDFRTATLPRFGSRRESGMVIEFMPAIALSAFAGGFMVLSTIVSKVPEWRALCVFSACAGVMFFMGALACWSDAIKRRNSNARLRETVESSTDHTS